jgi:long-subunit fatty acid transport protein
MRKISFLYILLVLQTASFAQQRTTYPCSLFGIGEINPKGSIQTMGMGRTGIALSSSKYLNNVNPASYHSIDSLSFFFDMGVNGLYSRYWSSDSKDYQEGFDLNLRNVAMGFRINPKWAGSIGISPYSTVGYKVNTRKGIEGVEGGYFDVTMTGAGGLSEFYINNSYLALKNLSLGVSLSYLFGSVESKETSSSSLFENEIIYKQTSFLKKVCLDFGAQYFFKWNDKTKISLGTIFGNSHRLNFKYRLNVSETDGTVYDDETEGRNQFKTPWYVGAGASVEFKNKLTISGDYLYQDWSQNNKAFYVHDNSQGSNLISDYIKYTHCHSFHLGAEYRPENYTSLGYFGAMSYRAGFYYQGSYFNVKNNPVPDRGISLGLGFPFRQNLTSFNISYNLGYVGNKEKTFISEWYNAFYVSLTLHDFWFIKRKID